MLLVLLQLKGKMKRKRRTCEEDCVATSKRKRHGSIGNITNLSSVVTPGRIKSASGTLTRTNSLRMIRLVGLIPVTIVPSFKYPLLCQYLTFLDFTKLNEMSSSILSLTFQLFYAKVIAIFGSVLCDNPDI